jgi:hypothetical protein
MVTYRPDIRYSYALKRGREQDEIMQKVMAAVPGIEEKWDTPEVEKLILQNL